METGCLEIVVNRKSNTLYKVMRFAAIVLAVCFCLLGLTASLIFLIPAAACGAAGYYFWLNSVVDYEYDYVDKELRVAKIQQKQRRKELAVYDLSKMEILAPEKSYQLDSFQNKPLNTIDYSSGTEDNRKNRYVLILEDRTKLILDLNGEYGRDLMKILKSYYPRKVFEY